MIVASNKDLEEEVEAGRFREDLFYRLNVVCIQVPPLRRRIGDLPLLFSHFMKVHSEKMRQPRPEISDEAMAIFVDFDWPGNVRQLENIVQRIFFSMEEQVDAELARAVLGVSGRRDTGIDALFARFLDKERIRPWREMEDAFQERYFSFVREQAKSDPEAARLLGLAPPNFHRMCKRLGLKT